MSEWQQTTAEYTFAWTRPGHNIVQLEGRFHAKDITIPVGLLHDARLGARIEYDLRIITYCTVWFIL